MNGKAINKKRLRKNIRLFNIINGLIISMLCFITLYPFWYVLVSSVSSGEAIIQGRITFYPIDINFESYKVLFGYSMVYRGYLNTLFYVSAGTAFGMTLTLLGAYPLSRPEFGIRRGMAFFIAFTMLFSGGLIPSYLVVVGLGMSGTIWAMIIPNAVSAFNLIVLRTFIQTIPNGILEAAKLDGCSHFRTLISIVIPCSITGIATILLFYLVGNWNAFMPGMLYLTQAQELLPIQNVLRKIQGAIIDDSMNERSFAD